MDTDAFLKLSQDLTQVDKLDADFAAAMLEAYETAGKGDAVAALVNGQGNDDLANDIVGKWYSGTSPNPDSEQVVTYTDAQMWYAMTYTKPMGYCGGGVGYWADVPEI
ncbi:ribonucleotide-diphosphate reductase subunit alpha [Falsihalocynthiibacter arcticus]|uniref:Ribonucleotide-diphosphate reductase subunit alpha n=1 Tax=Falsihalocynthiibacter arcticus TaxID=1579316 RepID=A0A126V6H3_9RHOB|nr:ribonucleotide-diphosphate reductase subunit alpha [Falsihalocynthiibacter arcticus]